MGNNQSSTRVVGALAEKTEMTKTACAQRRDQGPTGSSSTTTAVPALLKTRGTAIRTGTVLSSSRAGSMRWYGGFLRGKKLLRKIVRNRATTQSYRLSRALKTSPGGRRRTAPPPAPFNSTTFLIESLEAVTFSDAWDTCAIDE